ncbi:MAG: protein kinase, partial [Candidatus Hydrogenedentota bacterium]
RAFLLARLSGALTYVEGSLERRTAIVEEALAMARRVGDKRAVVTALFVRVFLWGRTPEEKIADATELVDLAEELGVPPALSWALFHLCNGYMLSGDITAAKSVLERLKTLEKRFSQPGMRFYRAVIESTLAFLVGRFDEAERYALEAFDHGQKVNRPLTIQFLQAVMIRLRAMQGRLDEMEGRFAGELQAYADVPGYRAGYASIDLVLGREEEARAEYERLALNDFSDLPQDPVTDSLLHSLSILACAFGDERRAAVLYDWLRPQADRVLMATLNTICLGAATHYLGMLAGTMRRWDDAVAHFEDALERNTRIGAPPLVAQTQYEYANVLLKRGNKDDHKKALELANKSLETAHALGMKALAEQALAIKLEIQEIDSKEKRRAAPTKQRDRTSRIVQDVDPMTGKTISRYKILEKLGEGGMGVVYKAKDTTLERMVALKFLSSQTLGTGEEKVRFIREAKAAAALDHPNICTVHEIDEAEGQTFIAMAYVDGQSLQEKIESGALEVDEALDIAIQVTEGLRRAHRRGIIHRDIKSANIMVTDEGQVKIMDFGLAKLAGQTRLTETATIMGTVAYMSPEQARGDSDIDHRTDVWSLGALLYEMLTGGGPFDAPSDAALIHKIIYEEPRPISELRGDIPPALEQAIHKMLQKNPRERYEDMAAVLSDLKAIRAGAAPEIVIEEKGVPSIAVLPFADMSPQKDQEYFCDGISESLINALTQLSDLRVIARTSAFSFKGKNLDVREIGKKLSVGTVLEGSIQKAGDRIRITAQLVNTTLGEHIWSEKYDREMQDVFAIQDEITTAIVEKLVPKLLRKERRKLARRQTVNVEAYELYLKGRWFWNKQTEEGIEKAIEYFEQAIEKSPSYALAYAGLSDSYILLPFFGPFRPKEIYPKAREAAIRALEIDDTLAEARTSLAIVKTFYDWDWEGAEREFQRAIELNPDYPTAHHFYAEYLVRIGQSDKAINEVMQALKLDPFSLHINTDVGVILDYAGRPDQAIEQFKKTIEMDPNFSYAHLQLGVAYLGQQMHVEAMAEFQKEKILRSAWYPGVECGIGIAYALMGESDKTRKIIDDLMERSQQVYVAPFYLAGLHFALGEIDNGFEWLEKAYEERDSAIINLKAMPGFKSLGLNSDPRYRAMLKKIGLDK